MDLLNSDKDHEHEQLSLESILKGIANEDDHISGLEEEIGSPTDFNAVSHLNHNNNPEEH